MSKLSLSVEKAARAAKSDVTVLGPMGRYVELDRAVDRAEGEGLLARWEFGREVLAERVGKKLPIGRLDEIATAIGKSRQEVQFRAVFAARFPDREALSNAVRQYGSWHELVAGGLTANPRLRPSPGTAPALPPGKYAVLLADPPWRYDFVEADNRAIENQYPTLNADEIACLEDADGRSVADLAADDAVLFLWATNPKLREALVVIDGWGFQYVTNLTWVKDRIGMGYWARQRHELLLIAVRGEMAPPPEHLRRDSVIEAPRRAHSEKPPAVHEYIEAVWPDVPKVELFAREARSGWATFGNQAPEAAA